MGVQTFMLVSKLSCYFPFFTLQDEDFLTLTHELAKIADRRAGGRMISVLEGGYNPQGLASAAVAHFRAMAE